MAHLFPGQARSFADDALIKSRPLWRKAAVHTGIPPWFWKLGCFLMYISVRKSDKFPKCGYICMVIVLRVICFLKERFFVCLFCFCFVFFLIRTKHYCFWVFKCLEAVLSKSIFNLADLTNIYPQKLSSHVVDLLLMSVPTYCLPLI